MATSTEKSRVWKQANPERWKTLQRKSRMKYRKPCKYCGGPMPYPSPGAKYCSNACRRVSKTAQQRARQLALLEKVWQHKQSIGCLKCKYNKCGAALDWHHPNSNKERRLSTKTYFTKLGKLERDKCVLLCANCHRELHVKPSIALEWLLIKRIVDKESIKFD